MMVLTEELKRKVRDRKRKGLWFVSGQSSLVEFGRWK